ncbi:MAG: hypothetical protein IKX36_03310 [Prevotella sp.]|nr:hypothetical protein [Prevotella sp.]
MKQNTKDWIQYLSAVALIASAIILAFTSFLMINDINAGTNAYIGIAISGGLAIFGVAAYTVNQVTQFKTEIRRELQNMKDEEAQDENHP